MNRLWMRLSLMYTLILLCVSGLIAFIFFRLPIRQPRREDMIADGLTEEQMNSIETLISTGVAEQAIRNVISFQLILFLILAIVVGMIGSFFISYRMTRPLTELEDAARKLGQHDLSSRIESPSGTTEMLALAESFNGMAESLESAEKRRQNLLADVSHELRTPLTVLQGNLRAALDGVRQLEPAQIAKLYDQTRQLNHLIDDLHDITQAEANRLSLDLKGVNLNQITQQAGEIFAPLAASEDIQLKVETPTVLPTIRGDRARLMQVLQNLVANGLRYAKSEIVLSVALHADTIQLTVSDDGEGIEADHLPHIFDRFYRADESRSRETGGSGLGLAIVKSIVEAHGGWVSAESKINHGTKFLLTFPLNSH